MPAGAGLRPRRSGSVRDLLPGGRLLGVLRTAVARARRLALDALARAIRVGDGGNGNDVFRTRDGEVDRITCGDGNDRAFLDQVDVITDATAENPKGSCEKVERKAPKAGDDKSEKREENRKS